jgi:hypothetical protein
VNATLLRADALIRLIGFLPSNRSYVGVGC